MTKDEWIDQLERGLAKTMPDMYPSGFARFLAEDAAEKGGYNNFIDGKYPDGVLWSPETKED